jgi:hypothetical protein
VCCVVLFFSLHSLSIFFFPFGFDGHNCSSSYYLKVNRKYARVKFSSCYVVVILRCIYSFVYHFNSVFDQDSSIRYGKRFVVGG